MATELFSRETANQIRVLIVDVHAVVREGVRMLLSEDPRMVVIGEAGNRAEALMAARRGKPDIILLELENWCGSGLDLLRDLVDGGRGPRIILLTGVRNAEVHRQAVRLGAMGLVSKTDGGNVLLKAIEKVHCGEAWLDHRLTAGLIAELSRPQKPDGEAAKIASLTQREREIIAAVCEGLKGKQIADRLFICEATVRNHLTSILSKLGLTDRFELAIYSYRHGLATPPANQSAE